MTDYENFCSGMQIFDPYNLMEKTNEIDMISLLSSYFNRIKHTFFVQRGKNSFKNQVKSCDFVNTNKF